MNIEIKESFTPKAKRDCVLVFQATETGDEHAYAQLLENYRESLYMLMFKMVRDPFDAEDLTIEAFSKAFKNLAQYSYECAFSTWLFKIAANNCIDFLRKKNKSVFSLSHFPNADAHDDAIYLSPLQDKSNDFNPEEIFFSKEQATVLRKIVSQLKPHYKKLVEMRYYEELTYEEIAQNLQISMALVKIRLFRAKEMLQSIMKNYKHL
jgi:RNA polymerase sigma-70 factor (ECF subfamily)